MIVAMSVTEFLLCKESKTSSKLQRGSFLAVTFGRVNILERAAMLYSSMWIPAGWLYKDYVCTIYT